MWTDTAEGAVEFSLTAPTDFPLFRITEDLPRGGSAEDVDFSSLQNTGTFHWTYDIMLFFWCVLGERLMTVPRTIPGWDVTSGPQTPTVFAQPKLSTLTKGGVSCHVISPWQQVSYPGPRITILSWQLAWSTLRWCHLRPVKDRPTTYELSKSPEPAWKSERVTGDVVGAKERPHHYQHMKQKTQQLLSRLLPNDPLARVFYYQSRSSLPRLWAGRSVPSPGREHPLRAPPWAPHTAYSVAL